MNQDQQSLDLHRQKRGKIRISPTVNITSKKNLSLIYSPGVATPAKKIAENKEEAHTYTSKTRNVAIVTDGSAVLGLGNVGPEASIPVMEGKAALFKELAGIDGYPIPLHVETAQETIQVVKAITPFYNGINLEDIKAPQCFHILEKLQELDIPVFHDDQHGTAIVILTALLNAMNLTKKQKDEKIVVNGAGAAGIATTQLLLKAGYTDILVLDSKGILTPTRTDQNKYKQRIAKKTNPDGKQGNLQDAIKDAGVFIGVSTGNILTEKDVKRMKQDPIIFALANPIPEIDPEIAQRAGAKIIATGRSDYPNQVNNALIFPGLFKGLIENGKKNVTNEDMVNIARSLSEIVTPTPTNILPDVFNKDVVPTIVEALKR